MRAGNTVVSRAIPQRPLDNIKLGLEKGGLGRKKRNEAGKAETGSPGRRARSRPWHRLSPAAAPQCRDAPCALYCPAERACVDPACARTTTIHDREPEIESLRLRPVPFSPKLRRDRHQPPARPGLRAVALGLLALCLCLFVSPPVFSAVSAHAPPPPPVSATSVYVLNADSGQVLYEKNANKRFPLLSITKLVTAYILMQDFGDRLSDQVTIRQADHAHGSVAGLKPGDIWSLRDLLYGMLLVSGNDAATAIADYVGRAMLAAQGRRGSGIEHFVREMRRVAASFGATHTSFADPDGMSRYNVSTAHDIAMIGRVVFRDSQLLPFWQCDRRIVHVGGPHARTIVLKSIVEDIGKPGIIGAKTGSYFSKGLYHLVVGWRAPNGQTIVAVVLGAKTHPARYDDMRKILDALPQDYPELSQPNVLSDPPPPPFHEECE
jgi:serine-type D-Ala-D-Ala carboxypeptidase (penicillin-binding protein 5/6)